MYYSEDAFQEAMSAYEAAEAETNKVLGEIFSSVLNEPPERKVTDEDIAILDKRREAWNKVIEIMCRQLPPEG